MAQEEKKETSVTPVGTGAYTHLHEPDKKIWNNRKKAFVETSDEDKWRFKESVLLDKGVAENEEYVAELTRRHTELGGTGLPSCLKDGDEKPKKKKGATEEPKARNPGKWELRFKSQYQPALITTAGEELPANVKIKAGDTVAGVIAFDECDTDIYTGLVTYLQSVVLVRKSKGHLEAAKAAISGRDFGDDVYSAGDAVPAEDEEEERSDKSKSRSKRRDY